MPELLIRGGDLVDQANGWQGRADVLFEADRMAAVGRELGMLQGAQVVDARGLLVVPGFVDTHIHIDRDRWRGYAMMARAGVTTALNLSGRMQEVLDGIRVAGAGLTIASLDSLAPGRELSPASTTGSEVGQMVDRSVESGALGVKILGGHLPFTPDTTAEIVRATNERPAYVAFHVGSTEHGSNLEGLREAAEVANGLALHIAHVKTCCTQKHAGVEVDGPGHEVR